jgi:hypothetical protein
MPISIPVLFYSGPNANIASGAASAATGTDCPANSLVVMGLAVGSAGQLATLTDSAGNVYTLAIRQNTGQHDVEIWYCINNIHLPSSGTFTATTVGGVLGYRPYGAIYLSGAFGGLDRTAGLSIASGTTYTLTTAALQFGTVIAVAANNDDGYTTYTEDPAWTQLTGSPVSNNAGAAFAYRLIINNPAAVSWSPNFNSQRVDAAIAVFDATTLTIAPQGVLQM